jgi:hypothetical protein
VNLGPTRRHFQAADFDAAFGIQRQNKAIETEAREGRKEADLQFT